ncbi:MAG: LAGLIDADG family homing endonuclease [Candidatus Kaiserbacteria bacterium]|nr:LAGLIDADG family homing endonuclease [Candidatus Kaiserbacteria bacterium]
MGSRSSITKDAELAYIAGFLDGDGSLMLQLKKRADSNRGVRFMATICLYQDSRHNAPLSWIRKRLKCGYVSKRNDGMTEFRVNGFSQVRETLKTLQPYLRFKKKQAKLLIQACKMLEEKTLRTMKPKDMRKIVDLLLLIQNENYMSKRRKTKEELHKILGLTP